MERGKATGPQKRRKRETPAAAPAEEAEEQVLDGEAEVPRGDDAARTRAAWDALLFRLGEEASRILAALQELPAGERVRKVDDLPLPSLRRVEEELTALRVTIEQAADLVL